MLTTSLRASIHQTRRFTPSLVAAHISTTSARRNQNPSSIDDAYDGLVGTLMNVGELKDKEGGRRPTPASGEPDKNASFGIYKERIHGFLRNRPLMPDAFTREKRIEKRRFNPKKWDLGPPTKEALFTDVFRQLDIDPVKECMNPTLLSAYVTKMGRVKTRAETGLTMRSQRRVAKAIKRAKMMGIMPTHGNAWNGLYKFPK